MHTGMDKLIVKDHVARLRHASEEARVRIEAGIEQKPRGRLVEGGNGPLERFGVAGVAVEQARASAADGVGAMGGGEFGHEGGAEEGRGREGQEVVG